MYLVALGCSISEDYVNNTWCVCDGVEVKGGVKRKSEYAYFFCLRSLYDASVTEYYYMCICMAVYMHVCTCVCRYMLVLECD